ncbi:M23 family metallopeptidase [Janibacter sp. G56]|uniref:M23 family metallopeptidase n=1 Tax=Janibacter sp. G56 TaxID=3418717 RepID=UPI003D03B088
MSKYSGRHGAKPGAGTGHKALAPAVIRRDASEPYVPRRAAPRPARRGSAFVRVPATAVSRTLRTGNALPGLAAAALVVSAAGASVAQSSAQPLSPNAFAATLSASPSLGDAVAVAETEQADARRDTVDLNARRAAAASAESVAQIREAEAERAARAKERRAIAKKAAAERAREKAAQEKAQKEAARQRALAKAWTLPVKAPITSGFGYRWGRLHAGMDFGASIGTPLLAMSKGTVTFAGIQGGYGNKVEITYEDGTVSYYGHMNSISVVTGQSVISGQSVGTVGNTGQSTGPHLHLEIHPGGGGAVDPYGFLSGKGLL